MNADRYAELLKALQKLETALAKDGVKRLRGPLKDWAKARHAEAETGGRLDAFATVLAGRSAVQLLLRTVYVRVLEDLGLLDPARIRGQRGEHLFRSLAPSLGYRGFFRWIFRDLAVDFPDLFAERDDELPLPDEGLCKQVWDLWHAEDGKGHLLYDWQGDDFDSRFLGNLYQDLDADVRKRYALLQTPDFVESYILDHTLTPALAEFDPAELEAKGEAFRLIDPTCGSGHFLIGGFHRLADYWQARGLDDWSAVTKALDGIWGCDLNPHAVHIARFRLLLEVINRTGVKDVARLAALPVNLRAMDSLIPWEGPPGQIELLPGPAAARLEKYGTAEERALNAEFLGRDFHVVVGNPPYVTPKDPQKRDDYRVFWPDSASGKYALSAPFAERLFILPIKRGFVGQITSNSFSKRSFGRNLVRKVFQETTLYRVVDTSGLDLAGHGTPTVILLCRNERASNSSVVGIFGKKGSSANASHDDARSPIWQDIRRADVADVEEGNWVTVDSYDQAFFHSHPWTLEGGHTPILLGKLTVGMPILAQVVKTIGNLTKLIADEVYMPSPYSFQRTGHTVHIVEGDRLRDFTLHRPTRAVNPNASSEPFDPLDLPRRSLRYRWFWRYRPMMWNRRSRASKFAPLFTIPGAKFYEFPFYYPEPYRHPTLMFPFVATDPHFVLVEGGVLANRTAPAISVEPFSPNGLFTLFGLLNSSTLSFWMKQIVFSKRLQGEAWETFYEFDATKLKQTPITEADRAPRIDLAAALHDKAQARAATLPTAILAGDDWTAATLAERLEAGAAAYQSITAEMVALQEELDWLTYRSYGLLDGHTVRTPSQIEPLRPGHRPFEIALARHNAACAPEERSSWFTRHGHDETPVIPDGYSDAMRALIQERLGHIEAHKDIRLIEQPQFKRRWQLVDYPDAIRKASAEWLLDRLEDLFHPGDDEGPAPQPPGPLSAPRPHRLEEIVNAWREDPRVEAVAAAHLGHTHPDLAALAEQLLRHEAIPDNIFRVYTDEGLRKLRQWQEVWRLQDREDAGEDVGEIPLPPKLAKGDFADARFYQIRGKLNVPRERFVLYADLRPHRYGWNGWRDTDRAVAQVEAFAEAEGDATDPLPPPTLADPRRCGATVGLWETLPDVKRWGEAADYAEFSALAAEGCQQSSCPCAVAEAWQEWVAGDRVIDRGADAAPAEVSVEERAAVIGLLQRLRPMPGQTAMAFAADTLPLSDSQAKPVTRSELEKAWTGSPHRLDTILDDLVASGDVATSGRGRRTRYRLNG